ncbi:O-antigen ligase domain-containing protein [Candidatus Parcubacteria bacterium]|nr:MAG: O-antigen ligase domain-containing protein [Candidatus Parcubacteria bacterium]
MRFISAKKGHKWQIWLIVFILAELLSWLAFSFDWLNIFLLVLLAIITGILVFLKPNFALYIPLAELFWGSLGHSWQYNFLNTRLVVFSVVLLVFGLRNIFKIKNLKILKDKRLLILYLFLLAGFAGGLISSFYNNYPLVDIFKDANSYLYLFYLPVWYEVYQKKYLPNIIYILQAAALVIAVKTLVIFNIFVHDYQFLDTISIYKWIRDTRTGEITPFANNFVRVFMQSQFYVLAAWLVTLIKYIKNFKNKNNFLLLSVFSAALLISLSRSFWLAWVLALLMLFVGVFLYQRKLPHFYIFLAIIGVLLSGFILTDILYNLPRWNSLNIFTQRSVDSSEAALSSRQALLPVIWGAIKEKPVLGYGFGKELTYKSSDPRIKNISNPEGYHTTYAFEWGWLDQWLKAGIIFVACFIGWVLLVYIRSWQLITHYPETAFIAISFLTCVVFAHIFSPYLNHPLGLGMLMFLTIFVSKYAQQSQDYN